MTIVLLKIPEPTIHLCYREYLIIIKPFRTILHHLAMSMIKPVSVMPRNDVIFRKL
jgi:hypothetical protein